MRILIDSQKSFELDPVVKVADENGGDQIVLSVQQAYDLLDVWRDLDIGHRAFSWPGDADEEPLVIMWVDGAGSLTYEWVSPYWDGRQNYDMHSLDAIARALPVDGIQYGERIGEPTP